jgi:hypothetical protein
LVGIERKMGKVINLTSLKNRSKIKNMEDKPTQIIIKAMKNLILAVIGVYILVTLILGAIFWWAVIPAIAR